MFTWTRPLTGTPNGDAPSLLNTSYNFKAEVEIPQGGAEGMLITQGGRFGGYGFYLLKGKPVFLWNLVDLKRVRWEGPEALTPGKHTLEFDFKYDGLGLATMAFNNYSGIGRAAPASSRSTARKSPRRRWSTRSRSSSSGTRSSTSAPTRGTGVNDADYQPPFTFTGKINKITLTIDRPKLTPADEKMLMEKSQRNNSVTE